MDININKYIGQFLLRNKYCSLPLLGVFELRKEAARVSQSTDAVSAPRYTILFTPVGSIDDTFASFIASAENVSISNASNNIREYCKSVKDQLANSGKFEIELLGTFTLVNNKIVFTQSKDLDMGAEPAPLPPLLEKPKTTEGQKARNDYSYPPAPAPRKANRGLKIFFAIIGIAVFLGAAAWFAYHYFNENEIETPVENPVPVQSAAPVDTLSMVDSTQLLTPTDSTQSMDTVATNNNLPASPVEYSVAILTFDNEAAATAKSNKLQRYGNPTRVVPQNGKFVVAVKASHPGNDTTILVDSLRRFFNPKGQVYILK